MTAVPDALRQDLRALSRRYGAMAVVAACAELVRTLALRGMAAEIAERRGNATEQCPRCKQRDALHAETLAVLRRTGALPAAPGDGQ